MWVQINKYEAINLDRVERIKVEPFTVNGEPPQTFFYFEESIYNCKGIPDEIRGMLGIKEEK